MEIEELEGKKTTTKKTRTLFSNIALLLYISLQKQFRIQKEEAKKLLDLEAHFLN